MSIIPAQAEFLLHACYLVLHAASQGYVLTGGELERPLEMQKLYVKTGRSKTMNSRHGHRMALDLNIFKDGKLCTRAQIEPLGRYWEALSAKNRWGGSWRGKIEAGKSTFVDAPHFERMG